MKTSETTRTTESVKERKKFAAKIANCLVQLLLFWKLCTKKDKRTHEALERPPASSDHETGKRA